MNWKLIQSEIESTIIDSAYVESRLPDDSIADFVR